MIGPGWQRDRGLGIEEQGRTQQRDRTGIGWEVEVEVETQVEVEIERSKRPAPELHNASVQIVERQPGLTMNTKQSE